MKIVVTGASGFIGGNLVEFLAANSQLQILASGRSSTRRFDSYKNVSYIQRDLCQPHANITCDICIHCAGLADDQSNEQTLYQNNVQATNNLLNTLNGCKVFIHISSSSVYDFTDGKIKTEEDASFTNKLSNYGKSKLQAESIIHACDIPSVYILRPRAVYGKGDRVLLPRILQSIKNNKLIVPGSLTNKVSLTHIQNLCEVIGNIIIQAKPGIHNYNIADKKVYILEEVFQAIIKHKNKHTRLIHIPLPIVSLIMLLNKLTGRKIKLSSQALSYLTQDAILDVQKAENDLNYSGENEFYNSLDALEGFSINSLEKKNKEVNNA